MLNRGMFVVASGFLLFGSGLVGCAHKSEPAAASAPASADVETGESQPKPAEELSADEPVTASVTPSSSVSAQAASASRVANEFVNVRKGPGMRFEIARVLRRGATVTVLSSDAVWSRIGDGEFVATKFLTPP